MRLNKIFQATADSNKAFAHNLRKNRFELFRRFLTPILAKKSTISVLDVGGTVAFWERMEFANKDNIKITLLNLAKQNVGPGQNVTCLVGNGCDMANINDREFDVVFSNSVIEHVETFEKQRQMAREIQRVGSNYFVQTPNYWFPIEPHFLMIGFQYMPVKMRAFLIRRFSLGWFEKVADYNESLNVASSIRLLRRGEIEKLFPGATIIREKLCGLTKSFMAYKYQSSNE
jgi:2-polyprenyl-3-methyl-5-hydroxy-6-metoxy-1,4-benzoquinol methylase